MGYRDVWCLMETERQLIRLMSGEICEVADLDDYLLDRDPCCTPARPLRISPVMSIDKSGIGPVFCVQVSLLAFEHLQL